MRMAFLPPTTRFSNFSLFDMASVDKDFRINEMDFFNEKRSISYLSSVSGGIYIHVPFCRKKCIYCDFYSVGDRIAPWSDFVDALIAELHARRGEIPARFRPSI